MPIKKKPARPTSYVALDETSQALLDSSVESAFVMDVSGYVLAANDAASKLFDLQPGETLQRSNIYELLPSEAAESRRAKVTQAIQEVRAVRFEEEIEGRSLVHSIVPVANPWGEVARLAVHTLDLTKLRRTDEDLRREQQRQIFFMESLPGIVYHLYSDQTIRYANRYFRRYFGSPKNKLCKETLNCTNGSCSSCPPMESMSTDRAMEWDWTDAQGRTFHLQCSPMTDSNGERMIMVLGIDITARQRAEDALKKAHDKLEDRVRQRTKELERANTELTNKSQRLVTAMEKADAATRAKSSFLANMSHEIRTPLNAVLGMSELALSISDKERKDHCLERVIEAGNSLLSVINDILDFSKIEAHKLTLENIDFDLRQTLATALDLHALAALDRDLYLTSGVDDTLPQALVGDPSRLRQIFINLVGNAIKFTETGGIHVTASQISPPADLKHGDPVTVEFSITDTGVGIPKDKQQDIFRSFLQADDSVTRKYGGTGLGLAICKSLVELMGGKLKLESKEGQGSTFSFAIDLKVGDPTNINRDMEESVEAKIQDLPNLKVLLADDNPLNRKLATALLDERGHTVLAVNNGMEALNALKEQSFDIVLMDIQMPIMDGVSATRAIRDPNSGALDPTVPIVALTAYALKGDRERFLKAGMNDYISKPISIQDFYSAIARTTGVLPAGSPALAEAAASPPRSNKPYDRETALDMLGGQKRLLARMDEMFLQEVPLELKELVDAHDQRDWDNAKRLAHSIKGSARTVGAQRLGTVAEQMEYIYKQKDTSSAKKGLKTLESEVQSTLKYIVGLLGNQRKPSPESVKERNDENHSGS
ncbi:MULTISPECIES: PAS domain-containing hybrid sensor histidine kinase/response regulator [unclassified Pseudodesulfovibrio]|uniref:PAS domain-containing hybrid sensor histidine kinase/response regulator n=1 Tax=unclassified Pseudodesulfovibrio TaxID=2661612 RepID=UPI000FEB7204|nr:MULTISPECIES: PAS domain-containing hybrid sensor histidine kinase/response regulator [unclassified Pseudodesulfovibrio]MCJ2166008.1 ATP-binding protein [Pseudodesulfovibrio sp. S3-i]RWU02553.1 PAS domain-containing sensor histidine kinase [Pseudodesulfovibrio sp. S3]